MASIRKSYFLAPSWDIKPEEVVLGSVIANLNSPHTPLSAPSLSMQIDTTVHAEEQPASGSAKKAREWTVGLFSTFLQMFTIGGELSYTSSGVSEIEYDCQTMKTQRFKPSLTYIDKVASDNGVLAYLKMSGLGSKAFIITGVKTAKDITLTTTEEQQRGLVGQLGVDIPPAQLTVGPKGSYNSVQTNTCTTTIAGPVVFAFQVEKLHVTRKGEARSKEYVSGAMLGVRQRDELVIERDGSGLNEEEMDDFGMDIVPGVDEETGEACDIVFIGREC
ncbi:hypothetical protein F4801DRAFT_557008 [Xylaria longipes]|nr:hypothetical protein F4801DRAFT_557008 [Xylaria longipes]